MYVLYVLFICKVRFRLDIFLRSVTVFFCERTTISPLPHALQAPAREATFGRRNPEADASRIWMLSNFQNWN